MLLRVLAVVLISCLHGCVVAPAESGEGIVKLIPVVPERYSGQIGRHQELYLELGLIEGQLYGSPISEPRWYFGLASLSAPSIDLNVLGGAVAPYAKRFNASEVYGSFDVTPADARMVRLSTVGVDNKRQRYLSGKLQLPDGDTLLLVYFDRPCEISGEVDFGEPGIYRHDIKIEHSGLYRLRIAAQDGYRLVTADDSVSPIQVVLRD